MPKTETTPAPTSGPRPISDHPWDITVEVVACPDPVRAEHVRVALGEIIRSLPEVQALLQSESGTAAA